jgi:hypothetical protein
MFPCAQFCAPSQYRTVCLGSRDDTRYFPESQEFLLLSDMDRYGFDAVPTNGIQEVARSIRVSSTNRIKHLAISEGR